MLVTFHCYLIVFFIQEAKNIDKNILPFLENHILYLIVPKSTKATLSFYFCFALVYLLTLNM